MATGFIRQRDKTSSCQTNCMSAAEKPKKAQPKKRSKVPKSRRCNIFHHIFIEKCLNIWTYWHFGIDKNAYFPDKKAPYIGICQFKVSLLSGTPRVRIAPGTPKSLKTLSFWALFFCRYSSRVVFRFSAHIS